MSGGVSVFLFHSLADLAVLCSFFVAVLAVPRLAVSSSSSAKDDGSGVEFEMAAEASTLWKLAVKPLIRILFAFLIALWAPSTLAHLFLIVGPTLVTESLFSLFVVRDDLDRDGWQEHTVAKVTAAWVLVAIAADVKGHLLLGAVAWGDGVPGGGALQFFPRTFTQE